MAKFDLLAPPYLADAVANPALSFLKKKYGNNGLKIEKAFSPSVRWSPTIQIRSSASELTLVEVAEALYPAIFNVAYASLLNEEATRAIKVYQACPLSTFQADTKHEQIRKLKAHGFGVLTVDEDGKVDMQFSAAVLIHHVSDAKFSQIARPLPTDVKAALSNAFDVYRTDAKQGLQHSGQVVEALIHLIAGQCDSKEWLIGYKSNDAAAKVIDSLYNSTEKSLVEQRASFGGARQFMKLDRNPSSHPSKTKKQANAKSINIRDGFELSLRVCDELCKARKALGFRKKLSL